MSGLVLFALGFAGAAGICSQGIGWGWIVLLMIAAAGLFGLSMYFRRRLALLGIAAIACAGLFLGSGWYLIYQAVYLDTAVAMDGQTQYVTIQASDYSESSGYGGTVDGRITLDGKSYQVCAYLDENKAISPGDEITGTFRFRVTTPGGAEDTTYHQGKEFSFWLIRKGRCPIRSARKRPGGAFRRYCGRRSKLLCKAVSRRMYLHLPRRCCWVTVRI